MLWLVPWLAILFGIGTTSTAAAYVAVTRYGLVEVLAAAITRRGLKGLAKQDAARPGYKVTRIDGGVAVNNLQLATSLLNRLELPYVQVQDAEVDKLDVTFPTWTRPLSIRARGLRVNIRERTMPQHVDAENLAKQEKKESDELKKAKLEAIDHVLWGLPAGKKLQPTSPEGTYGSRLRARSVHRMIAFIVDFIRLDLEDLTCTYYQDGEPGPLPNPTSHMQGRDAAVVSIRRVSLEPQQQKVRQPEEVEDSAVAGQFEDEDDHPTALMQLIRMPTALWKRLTLNEGRYTRAALAGVSVSVCAFDERETDDAPACTSGALTEDLESQLPIFRFSTNERAGRSTNAAASSSSRSRLSAQEGAPPSSVRRKRQRDPLAPLTTIIRDSPKATAAERKVREEHVILRQWGAEIIVSVLPPFHRLPKNEQSNGHSDTADSNGRPSFDDSFRSPLRSPFESHGSNQSGQGPAPQQNGDSHQGSTDGKKPPPGVHSHIRSQHPPPHKQETIHRMLPDVEMKAAPATFSCTVDIEVKLRAFVPDLSPQSVAVAVRMLDRTQQYSQYSPYWQVRPEVGVSRSPGLWWQHAGNAAARECRLISRRQVALKQIEPRRANRLQYQTLYAKTHSRLNTFTEVQRKWWMLRQVPKGGHEDRATLKALEEKLSLEEIAHFRAGVASKHSKVLLDSTDHLTHVLDAVDAVVGNLGPLPIPVEAMLFQKELRQASQAVITLTASASCPRIGLTLGNSTTPPASPTATSTRDTFDALECTISDTTFRLGPAGDMKLVVKTVEVNGSGQDTREHILLSPSPAANHMLQVADLHGVVSKAKGFTADLRSDKHFLTVKISTRSGQLSTEARKKGWTKKHRRTGAEVEHTHAAVEASDDGMDLRPPGMAISVRLAGIEVEFRKKVALAAMKFFEDFASLKDKPLRDRPCQAGTALLDLKPEPGQPATLTERVFHAFAQHNMPVYKPLTLPVTFVDLSCPGIAMRICYKHNKRIGCQQDFTASSQNHELIAAVTRIRFELGGEDFREFMRAGASQCSSLHAYVDLFCYQPPQSRDRSDVSDNLTRATAFGNRTLSGQRRDLASGIEFGADQPEEKDDEMAAMAKVWAHPEDLHKYPLGEHGSPRRTSFPGQHPAVTKDKRLKAIPPFPLIPLLKLAGLQAEINQKVVSLPAAPGRLHINVAATMHGIMLWISPWQLEHLLSIINTIKAEMPTQPQSVKPAAPAAAQKSGASAMRTQLRLQGSLEIPLISAICSVARSRSELEAALRRPRNAGRVQWKHQIHESDPAYLWAQCLAPVYGINILSFRSGLSFKGTGHLRGGGTIDGLLIRDLQLQPKSRFAYFLRPLPARAEALTHHATRFRTQMLRVVRLTPARRKWAWAVRKVILRQRSRASSSDMEDRMFMRSAALPFTSFVGLRSIGPQLVACTYLPPAEKYPGHPDYKPAPPAKLQAQLGVMLLYVRVSNNNRMLPFCSEVSRVILDLLGSPKEPPAGQEVPQPAAQETSNAALVSANATKQPQQGARFAGLQVDFRVSGVDLKAIVQGRELLSVQLLETRVLLNMAPDPPGGKEVNRMLLKLNIKNINVIDLQARPEHAMVLRPMSRAKYCSLALEFSTFQEQARPPLLVIELANPRFLALFRFVYDILHGIDIITGAFAKNTGQLMGEDGPSISVEEQSPSPEILVHLNNSGIVLPASSQSRNVISADVDYIMFGMPGNTLSDTALNSAGLPSIRSMMKSSQTACTLFKVSAEPAPEPEPRASRHASPARSRSPERRATPLKPTAKPRPSLQPLLPHLRAAESARQPAAAPTELAEPKRQAGVIHLGRTAAPKLPVVNNKGVLTIHVPESTEWRSMEPSTSTGSRLNAAPSAPATALQSRQAPASLQSEAHAKNVTFEASPAHIHKAKNTPLPDQQPGDQGPKVKELEPQMVIFAEGVKISRARIQTEPNRQHKNQSFCPKSVESHTWAMLDYITSERTPFIQPSNYAVVMYQQDCPHLSSGAYQHLHLAASPIVALLNAPNYQALMGFAQGNLAEISSYDKSDEGSSKAKDQKRTTFNPEFQFAPPRNDMPVFRMTAKLPRVSTVMEADPQHWQSGAIRSRLGDPEDIPRLPFMRARVFNVEMDLGVLEKSGATYLRFGASGLSCDDLRLAYSKIMTEYEVVREEGEDTVSDLPQSFARSAHDKSQLLKLSDSNLAQMSSEIRASLPGDSKGHERSSNPNRARRERSGEVLRAVSLNVASQSFQTSRPSTSHGATSCGTPRAPKPDPGQAPLPVLSMEVVNSLEAYFPDGSPVVHLLKAPSAFLESESAHLKTLQDHREDDDIVSATIGLQKDGSIAIEVDVALALLQWPFLTDISLVWAAASIFDPAAAPVDQDPSSAAATAAADALLMSTEPSPWLYFNAILRDSQVFIPVADPEPLGDAVKHYFGGGEAAMNFHERLADLLLMQLSFSMEEPDYALTVEGRGLSIAWSALRVSYCMGGDGESSILTDLRHLAAFVRDPCTVVSCVLLPFSSSIRLEMQAPQVEEKERAKRQQKAVIMIQRFWRKRRWQKAAERCRDPAERTERSSIHSLVDAARAISRQVGSGPTAYSKQKKKEDVMDKLIQEVASPRTHGILKGYQERSKNAALGASHTNRASASTRMVMRLGACTIRGAFSHIPFIQSVLWATNSIVLSPSPGNMAADSSKLALAGMDKDENMANFRPSTFNMDGSIESISAVLCNDKPQTFGAPDVLRVSIEQVTAKYVMDQQFHDRPPSQVADVNLQVSAQFLNNSSSRWEAICESWEVQAELVDQVSPIYRSDFQRHMWLTSKQHLSVKFNPSALLSFGDLLAYVNAIQSPLPEFVRSVDSNFPADMPMSQINRIMTPEAAPDMEEQLAQQHSITSRVPQKYLIQNQSAMRVYYWSPGSVSKQYGPLRTHTLPSGVSETLKVTPTRKVLQHVTSGRGGVGKVQNVISLHFEGNWMPITDVAISVVGKYRYQMYSPAEQDRVHVVVDIILVGRTKIITLHSGLWLENRMDRKLSFRLHVPVSPLVAPGSQNEDHKHHHDRILGPLKPGQGLYLPVIAVLGGLLFVRPSGFKEANRDVIRLGTSIVDVQAQQGHITCEPLETAEGGPSIQAPLHCSLLVRPAQVNSEFQAFKHIEMVAPGEFTKATESLEATLAIHPTLVLTNALPYVIDVIVWQVPPFRKLREEKTSGRRTKCTELVYYDFKQMQAAFTGTVPILGDANPYSGRWDAENQESPAAADRKNAIRSVIGDKWSSEGHMAHKQGVDSLDRPSSMLETPSRFNRRMRLRKEASLARERQKRAHGKASDGVKAAAADERESDPSDTEDEIDQELRQQARKQFKKGTHTTSKLAGEHISVTLAPGVSQNVYANMEGNVLVHIAVPALGMVATHWAVVCWSKSQILRETFYDLKYIYRLPKEIQLKNAAKSRQGAPAKHKSMANLAEYTRKLKDAGHKFRESAKLRSFRESEELAAAGQGTQPQGFGTIPRHRKTDSDASFFSPALPMPTAAEVLDGSSAPQTPRDPPETPRHLPDGHGPSWFYNTAYDEHTSPDSQDDQRSFMARHSNVNLKGADKDDEEVERPGSSGRGLVASGGSGVQTRELEQLIGPSKRGITTILEASPESEARMRTKGIMKAPQASPFGEVEYEGQGEGVEYEEPLEEVEYEAEPQRTASTTARPRPFSSKSFTFDKNAAAKKTPHTRDVSEIQPDDSYSVEGRRESRVKFSRGDLKKAGSQSVKVLPEEEEVVAGRRPKSPRSATLLRAAFDRWREYSVRKATGHTGRKWQSNVDGVNAPDTLLLNIQNSLSTTEDENLADSKEKHSQPLCQLSFYSPYWVDNRTNMDLVVQDHASAAGSAFLFGHSLPTQYTEVRSPAVGLTEPETPNGSHRSFWDIENPSEIEVRPALLNKQDKTRFCLASVAKKKYSASISLSTVGLKGSMRVKGPVPQERVPIGKAVQDGMRAMFKAANSPVKPVNRSFHEQEQDVNQQRTESNVTTSSIVENNGSADQTGERVKVHIAPLVNVSIRELPSENFDQRREARLQIKPKRISDRGDEIVSVRLEVCKPEESSLSEQRIGRRESQVNLDNVLQSFEADTTSDSFKQRGQKKGSELLSNVLHPSEKQQSPTMFKVGQREYEFVAEVTSAPPNSVFQHTKVLTIKPRFVINNQTGMAIEVKQKMTPNLDEDPFYGSEARCSCRLAVNQRTAFHWDNFALEKSAMVRPLGDAEHGGVCEWEWSGSFTLSAREEYFGLRIRHKNIRSRAINIPVNCTVGPSGCVLITFKSRLSVPPYRIENKTSDVMIYFAQAAVAGEKHRWNWLRPCPTGSSMAYAWDEPGQAHKLQVQAQVQNRMGRNFVQSFDLDKIGAKSPLNLPSASKNFNGSGSSERMKALEKEMSDVPSALKDRVASVLASSEFSKKVYVMVYADGPTRVLCFSDEPTTQLFEAEQSVLDLAARLKQVEADLAAANSKFLQLHGPAGGAELDLYGRAAMLRLPHNSSRGSLSRAESEREDKTGGSTAGRIRLRQRGMSSDGSPLTLPRPDVIRLNDEGPSMEESTSLPRLPSRDRRLMQRSSLAGKVSKTMDVVQPDELSHQLSQLHVPTSSQAVQGSELMKSGTASDAALVLGGDLLVTIWKAEGLEGNEKSTHPFVRIQVEDQSQLTSVQWNKLDPEWDETLTFKDVSAAAELLLEVWDVGGTQGAKQLQKMSEDPNKVIENARFLGSVEIAMTSTLAMHRGSKHWFDLMRRTAGDKVSGAVRLSFAWDVTARSLLTLKLNALERVMAQRVEVLCMLNPVTADIALQWAKEDLRSEAPALESKATSAEFGDVSIARSSERSLADQLLAKHMHEEHHSTLNVSILEARGLRPRSGVVVAFQANQLPNPVVEVDVPNHNKHTAKAAHTLSPRWDHEQPASYARLSSDTNITIRIYDRKSRSRMTLLGENIISCSRLKGEKPMYIWLPLLPIEKHKRILGLGRKDKVPDPDALESMPELQVHLRLQWVRQLVRGQYMNAEVNLAGLGVIFMGGLQDELFNLTLDQLKVSAEVKQLEARLSGSVKRLQLDNQMLDATQPVVLAPASVAHAQSRTAQALSSADMNLIEFTVARSFANTLIKSSLGDQTYNEVLPAGNREGHFVAVETQELQEGQKFGDGTSSIMSFKEVGLTVGELDFQADDGFLEAILSFVVSVPTADIWQDAQWRENQRKLLTAQFGPKEVETLSMNESLIIDSNTPSGRSTPLEWMQSKELRELQVLRDQSSYSSWYFIERAHIGDINANVTIALTSSVLSARQDGGQTPSNQGGLFTRFIGASGFQLINVNNVPLSLKSWMLDTRLLGKKAMINSLLRHYFAQALSEAHKVLGGAGPAIAAVPLTVVWVGGSFVSLLGGIGQGKVGPRGAAQRIGYVFFMSVAQVIGSLSRIGLSVMTSAPPNRTGRFSDSQALTRAVQRPAHAFEAFGRCWEELFNAFMNALLGIPLDPTKGYHYGGIPWSVVGVAKGTIGIAVRPAVGILELISKGTHGMGLVCLGREAITGSAQRRVRAPGAMRDEFSELMEDLKMPEVEAQQRNVVAAWQQSLGHMFPDLKEEEVLEVIDTQASRTLLLCQSHVALLRSKSLSVRSTYRSLWAVPISEIKIVRGNDEKLQITIEYTRKVDAKCFGVWSIPKKRYIKCGSREMLERIVVKINRHLTHVNAGPEDTFAHRFDPFSTTSLSIYRRSYRPGPLLQDK